MPAQGGAIGGRPVALAEAIAAAAALLGQAASVLVAGLRTDAAGAVAAVTLARRLDGVLDHADSSAALRDLTVMRQAGWIVATPLLARARADTVLLVGEGHDVAWPGFADRLALDRPPTLAAEAVARRVLRLDGGEVMARLGVLRALVRKRRIAAAPADLVALAEALRGARYGVIVWSAAHLETLAIEMLCGLIDDLNATTRFAGLPLPAAGNAAGVAQALAAETGFPFRTAFRAGTPRHDPWRYDASRMADSGEADAALWLDALGGGPPSWAARLKLVAVAPPGSGFAAAPDVAIAVGRPGVDHAAALFDPASGALLASGPARAGALPNGADVIAGVVAALPPC